MNELHLFAGAGGGILGGILLGHTTVCAVEIEPYCRQVLLQRQRDGILPKFPIWDDVRTFDGKPWRGLIDVLNAGIPCQLVSCAGFGGGFTKQDYYQAFLRIVREVEPRSVFLENSPFLVSRGLGTVLRDMAKMGLNGKWGVLGACDAGFDHKRERIWVLLTNPKRRQRRQESRNGSNRRMGRKLEPFSWDGAWLSVFTRVRGDGDGLARNVDRTDAIRNGQVPRVAALAWRTLI